MGYHKLSVRSINHQKFAANGNNTQASFPNAPAICIVTLLVDTTKSHNAINAPKPSKSSFKFTEEHSALKRNAQLDEIGKSALYFVSDLSSAVTGEVHYVDCGYNIIGMPNKF